VKYGFVKEHTRIYSVNIMCNVFNVSRSGYYSWLNHKPGKRELANTKLDEDITTVYTKNKKRYGAPRITETLNKQGVKCSSTRVARRMSSMNIKAVGKRKYKMTTDSKHNNPIFANVLSRDFSTTNINQKWCCDITYIPTREGWLYLATVIDIHSRAVIGWSMARHMKKQLVCDALLMALFKRKFPKGVIIHTDRGSQYCSNKYRGILAVNHLIGSMSRKGNCWDNSIAESFFHTLKVELIYENNYQTRQEAKSSIFQYIEGYYNLKRIHSSIDYNTPLEIECVR
tara:strand:+ start:363 stop:1217 length:855 start_codon:yes stop_codon:yes gene_type:complete